MEGYLFKKGRAESSFGFDQKSNKPYNKKGVIPVYGCTIKLINDPNREFSFDILHPERKPFSIQAETKEQQDLWMKQIFNAAHSKSLNGELDLTEYYEALDLDPDSNPSANEINKAYRKKALVVHPDKGGDMKEFKKIQEAVDILLSKIEETEKELLYDTVFYDITVIKGPKGEGIGLVVTEDTKKRSITVKDILPSIKIVSASNECEGKVLRHDRLVMIEEDDVMYWPIARVVQRLSDFRVPVGSSIQLTLSRKVLKDGSNEPFEEIDEDDESLPKELFSLPLRSVTPTLSKRSMSMKPDDFNDIDDDASTSNNNRRPSISRSNSSPSTTKSNEFFKRPSILKATSFFNSKSTAVDNALDQSIDTAKEKSIDKTIDNSIDKSINTKSSNNANNANSKQRTSSYDDDIDETDRTNYTPSNEKISRNKPIVKDSAASTTNNTATTGSPPDIKGDNREGDRNTDKETNTSKRRSRSIYDDLPIAVRNAVEAAHNELIKEIKDLKKLLSYSNEEKNNLIHQQSDVEYENNALKRENEKLFLDLKLSKSKEEYFDFQLQHALFHNEVTDDQVNKSVKDMIVVSSLVKKGKDIAVS
eukprot:gene17305-22842_t